jgi:hypothetical protein
MENNLSLKEAVDANDKIIDIRLSLRSAWGCNLIWILVEGDNDSKIYPKFIEGAKARVEYVGGGKGQLQIALEALTQETNQVIGIRDADFCHLEKVYPSVKNLFFTDYHDIEMTILSSDSIFDNLLTEYNLNGFNRVIRQNILEEASFIGYIRWFNEKNIIEILFKGLSFGELIEFNDSIIKLKKEELLDLLNQRSSSKRVTLGLDAISEFKNANKTDDFFNLCNGHDVLALLSLRLGSSVSFKELCRHCRIIYRFEDFQKTALFEKLKEWSNSNGYSFLKSVND